MDYEKLVTPHLKKSRPIWPKLGVCCLVGMFVAFRFMVTSYEEDPKTKEELTPAMVVTMVALFGVFGVLGGLFLIQKDRVQGRQKEGKRVSLLGWLFFSRGMVPVLAWFITLFVLVPILIILVFGVLGV